MRLPDVLDEQWFPRRCLRSFFEMQGLDRAMVIASQAFTALIPLIILASALLPTENHDSMADAIVRKFALTGDAATSVRTVFAPTGEATIGLVSILLLVFSGVSLTRRIQRMYLDAWQLPRTQSVRSSLYAAVALGALILELGLLVGHPLPPAPDPLRLGAGPQRVAGVERRSCGRPSRGLLLNRRVVWQRLLPAGILAGCAVHRCGATSPRCTCRG